MNVLVSTHIRVMFKLCYVYAKCALLSYLKKTPMSRHFLGGPVVKNSMFPMQGAQVQSLIRELDPTCCQTWKKSYDHNIDSILKSRDITLPTKVCLVKAMVFPVVMYGCESWTIKKAEHRRIDAFECGVGEDS